MTSPDDGPGPSQPGGTSRTVAITGASGLIGAALAAALRADGIRVLSLVRKPPAGPDEAQWKPGDALDPAVIAGAHAVVHLAGAGIGDRRWTEAYKRTVIASRVAGTTTIAEAMAAASHDGPQILVSGSAVGFYGDTGAQVVDETNPAGSGFLAEVCAAWEAATAPAEHAGIRVAQIRTGLVLAQHGGMLARLRPLFRLALGGRLGSGRQFQSWISLADEVRAIRFAIDNSAITGPVNLTGPEPVTNRVFTQELARAAHRPAIVAVPGLALRLVLGEFADEGVLIGQRAVPKVLLEHGFTFEHPTLADALHWAFSR